MYIYIYIYIYIYVYMYLHCHLMTSHIADCEVHRRYVKWPLLFPSMLKSPDHSQTHGVASLSIHNAVYKLYVK